MTNPDIRTDLLSDEQFDYNCMHHTEWAFYVPPEKFMFHHYDETADKPLIAERPMVGIERYVVNDFQGNFYGLYDTRAITRYIKTGTWVLLDSEELFLKRDVAQLEKQLTEKKTALQELQTRHPLVEHGENKHD
jgi:hypothetical protein